jgi:hypothetical protein
MAHDCTFVEEQEQSGRLILGPCLECGLPAMEIAEQLRQYKDIVWRARVAFYPLENEDDPDLEAILGEIADILMEAPTSSSSGGGDA